MQTALKNIQLRPKYGGDPSLLPGVVVMVLAVAVTLFIILITGGALDSYPYVHFVPWVVGLLIVIAIPNLYLFYKGRFSFADPIIFATYSYFVPAFVFGGFFFAIGWSQPHFVHLIQDMDTTIPMTLVLVAIGFAGLSVGYFLPIGRKLGSLTAEYLPQSEHKDESLVIPGFVLLFIGILNTTVALAFGLFGYQRTEEVGVFDAILNLTTIHWVQASFLLFLLIFRKSKIDVTTISIASVLLVVNFARLLFGGSRGSLLPIFSAAIVAYALSGRRFSVKQIVLASVAFAVILIAGMIYGTNFRYVKGGESQQDLGQYTENIFQTMDEVGRSDISGTIGSGFTSLAERLDIVSTLAVVVSIREQKQPFEEAYGLDDNIYKDSITSLIPRFLWSDKPSLSDPRAYSELYFDYGESSFAITPMGDLLRNYGYFGVFLGMLVLGFALRYIYASLIEGQPRSVWRMTMYFMLLISVSYESFYGSIIPFFFKTAAIAAIGIVIVAFLASRIEVGRRRKDPRAAF